MEENYNTDIQCKTIATLILEGRGGGDYNPDKPLRRIPTMTLGGGR